MAVKKGFKLTEVGEIPEDWEVVRLGDMISNPPQYGINAPAVAYNPILPIYLRITDISDQGKFLDENIASVTGADPVKYELMPGDIVLARTGASVGKSFLFKGGKNFVFAGYLIRVSPDIEKIIPYFLWLQTQTGRYRNWVKENSIRSGQPGLNSLQYSNYNIIIPVDKKEQSAIASALSDIDSLITSLEQLIAKKRLIKQGAMQELLTGRRRLPGFEGEWKTTGLLEIADVYQPKTIPEYLFTATGFPVYGANGHIGFYHSYNHESWQTTLTCRGSTCGTINKTPPNCWITGNAMVLNCDNNKHIDKKFFYYLMCNQDFTKFITGSGQPQIVREALTEMLITYPQNIDTQLAIAAVLSDMDAEISALEARLEKTHQIKAGMMNELLTGRIRLL